MIPTISILAADTSAPVPEAPHDPFPLWPEGAPGAMGREAQDVPVLTPYFAGRDGATGAAMVVCPGGGYVGLAAHEGEDYARWLSEIGVTALVLRYRLGSAGYRHPVMLQDAARAVRFVRSRAGEWGLDPRRIGIMGSSAGGHLAATLLTHFGAGDPGAADPIERESCRPDLGVLCYPVITMGEQGHAGCRRSLLGEDPAPELVRLLSTELQITGETPPTFLFHTVEDTGVPVQNSLLFAAALAEHGVPFALHVYPRGAHGMGLGSREWDPRARHPWTSQCSLWLQEHGFAR